MKNEIKKEFNLYAEPVIYEKYIPMKQYLIPLLVFICTSIIVLISQLIDPLETSNLDKLTIFARMVLYIVANSLIISFEILFFLLISGRIKQKLESRRKKVLLGFIRKHSAGIQVILYTIIGISMFFLFLFIIVEIEDVINFDYLSEWLLYMATIGLVSISLVNVVVPNQESLFDVKESSEKIDSLSTEIMKFLSSSEKTLEDENLILDMWFELDHYIDIIDDFLSSRAGIQLDQKEEITSCISMLLAAGEKDNVQLIKENLLEISSDIQRKNIQEIVKQIKLLHEITVKRTKTYEGIFLFKSRKTKIKETKGKRDKWIQILGIIVPIILVFLTPLAEKIVELIPL